MASNITTFTVATVSHEYAGTVAVSAVATISFHRSGQPLDRSRLHFLLALELLAGNPVGAENAVIAADLVLFVG